MKRIAVIGSGIAGLAAARVLTPHAQVTLFEAADRFGGHAHTVDVSLGGRAHGVDIGFTVFDDSAAPQFAALLAELGVATAPAEMSFSAQIPAAGIEWSSAGVGGRFRAARQSAAAGVLEHARRGAALQPPRRRAGAFGAGHRPRRFGRRLPRRASLLEGISRLVPAAAARLHLVVPERADAAHAGRRDGALLPRPRPAADAASAARAFGARRRRRLRPPHAGVARRRPPGDAGAARQAAADRRRRRLDRPRHGALRRRRLRLPQRRRARAPRRPERRRARGARRLPLPAQPRDPAHRRRRPAAARGGLGGLELRGQRATPPARRRRSACTSSSIACSACRSRCR